MNNEENNKEIKIVHTDDYYEAIASQEQVYLDEIEEHLIEILTCDLNVIHHKTQDLDEQLSQNVEELLSGDSDDPPLTEDTITDIMNTTLHNLRSDQCDVN